MQDHRSALPVVSDLHLQAKHVPELPFEGEQVGVDRLCSVPRAGAGNVVTGSWLDEAGSLLGLSDRKPLGDDFPRQFLRVGSRRDRTCMAHTDIALH